MSSSKKTRGAAPKKIVVQRVAAPKAFGEWLGPSELMDFSPAICGMARSIASRGKSERERALIAHASVRAMRLSFPRQSKPASASQGASSPRRRCHRQSHLAGRAAALVRPEGSHSVCGAPNRSAERPTKRRVLLASADGGSLHRRQLAVHRYLHLSPPLHPGGSSPAETIAASAHFLPFRKIKGDKKFSACGTGRLADPASV